MIKRILSILTLLVGGLAFADVPNTFQAGEAIKASEMNENFTSITNEVDNLTTKTANYSDMESDVASLKAKVELLESLLSSDDTAFATAEYVGVSSAATTGNGGGLSGMNQMCEDTYLGSRMCTTKDIAATGFPRLPSWDGGSTGYGWVHNNSDILNVTSATNSDYSLYSYVNWRNENHFGSRNCLGWVSRDLGTGTLLNSANYGDEYRASGVNACNSTYPVVCCK